MQERIVPPKFPARDFQISKFGAVGDGETDCTKAFAEAIAACSAAGGGRVVVPSGVFLSGAIHLKSGVNLHVSEGATIRFVTNTAAYLPVVFTRYECTEVMNFSAMYPMRLLEDMLAIEASVAVLAPVACPCAASVRPLDCSRLFRRSWSI